MNKMQADMPLKRCHMPDSYAISLDRYLGRGSVGLGYAEGESRIPGAFGPSQSMRGFEARYANIIDYIVRITHRIWEDRDVAYIADTYSSDSMVYDDYGLQRGSAKIIADTHHTTGAFSDIRLIADEVIWAGDDEVGFHTSHRTLIRGRNDGDSKYGPATGREVDVLVIANCVSRENVIFLEHVLYNNSSLLMQLGLDVREVAARMAAEPPAGWPRDEATWQGLRSAARAARPLFEAEPISGFDPDRFVRQALGGAWSPGAVPDEGHYASGFEFRGTSDRSFKGMEAYRRMVSEMREAFPDLEFQIDEVYWMGNERDGFLSAARWSATGTHAGGGPYGEPTGVPVQVWGLSQHRIMDQRIVAEWTLFNELELMMQIAAAR